MNTRKTILIVDDDRALVDSLEDVLHQEGYLVKTAENGKVALELLARLKEKIDLVTLDIQMPELHGLEFLKQIESVNRHVPIIMATSKKGLKHDFSIVTHPQVRQFVEKPYDLDALLRLIAKVVTPGAPKSFPILLIGHMDAQVLNEQTAFFENAGYWVVPVSDRDVAVTKTQRYGKLFDLLLLQIELLEGRDPWTVVPQAASYLQKINADQSHIPVVLTTSKGQNTDSLFSMRDSMLKKVLQEPVSWERIGLAVREIVFGS